MTTTTRILFLCLLLTVPVSASAQGRGRTDGPEGSEIGKGGYRDPFGGRFSLQLNWGAALTADEADPDNAPLFTGLTVGYWHDDWLMMELSGQYVFVNESFQALIGPRFRSAFYPVGVSFALKAGPMVFPDETVFGLSPEIGADVLLDEGLLIGMGYALDLPLGDDVPDAVHRVFLSLGYRF